MPENQCKTTYTKSCGKYVEKQCAMEYENQCQQTVEQQCRVVQVKIGLRLLEFQNQKIDPPPSLQEEKGQYTML